MTGQEITARWSCYSWQVPHSRACAAAVSMAARALINSRTVLNAAQVNAQAFFRSASARLPVKEWEKRRDQFTKLI